MISSVDISKLIQANCNKTFMERNCSFRSKLSEIWLKNIRENRRQTQHKYMTVHFSGLVKALQ